MNPRQSPTTHTEQLGDEASVYDWARLEVHALNPTAALVWRHCDGATSRDAIAAALRVEMGIPEPDAVVDLTLKQLARVHLLELPVESRGDRPAITRRWLLGRGVAAAMLPAIYSIVAPSPLEAQSVPPPAAPTLTSVSPNQGNLGDTLVVTLTGTNFVVGATAVVAGGGGVTVSNVEVGSTTSLTANFVIDPAAAVGARTVTVTTTGGTSDGQAFTINVSTGSTTFNFTGSPQIFTVPAGVVSITILATGAQGGRGAGSLALSGAGGPGGRTTATVSVAPGGLLTVRVGGAGPNGSAESATPGGFNGGGASEGDGGGGGGASGVRAGATTLVVVGGGGGGGAESGGGATIRGGNGGAGGGLIADPGETPALSGGGGGGGNTQVGGGAGGTVSPGSSTGTPGTAGVADTGGTGGTHQPGIIGGGGGGGGYFGGGGGGGGNPSDAGAAGGGGGSSFNMSGAIAVLHEKGVNSGNGSVTISW